MTVFEPMNFFSLATFHDMLFLCIEELWPEFYYKNPNYNYEMFSDDNPCNASDNILQASFSRNSPIFFFRIWQPWPRSQTINPSSFAMISSMRPCAISPSLLPGKNFFRNTTSNFGTFTTWGTYWKLPRVPSGIICSSRSARAQGLRIIKSG